MLQRRPVPLAAHEVGAVIIAPTRELAKQLFTVVGEFVACSSYGRRLSHILLTGGSSVHDDVNACVTSGCNIVVATPGRLLAIMEKTGPAAAAAAAAVPGGVTINWKSVDVLVLDEADTLLAMGFKDELTRILSSLPKQRRTGLFSATQTTEVKALARAGMRNPAVVRVQVQAPTASAAAAAGGPTASGAQASHTPARTPTGLHNFYVLAEEDSKLSALVHLIRSRRESGRFASEKWIVFTMTGAGVDVLTPQLQRLLLGTVGADGVPVGDTREEGPGKLAAAAQVWGLHGRMAAKKRSGVYEAFMQADGGVLVCTDVAARGIDIPDLDWCVQYDPPSDPDFFVHRVGRTARAGRLGVALVMLLPQEADYIALLDMNGVPTTHTTLQHMLSYDVKSPTAPPELASRVARADRGTAASTQAEAAAGVATLATVPDVTPAIMNLNCWDRDLLERGTRAFVAFVRGYQEHQCKYIFRFSKLHLAKLARGFALLKFPHLKDLRGAKKVQYSAPDEILGSAINTATIPYRDATREAARQAKRQAQLAAEAAADLESQAREKESSSCGGKGKGQTKRGTKRKRTGQQDKLFAEWDDFAAEERLVRKLRAGKISQAQFDAAVHGKELAAAGVGDAGEQGDGGEADMQSALPNLAPTTAPPRAPDAAEALAKLDDFVRKDRKKRRAMTSKSARKGMLYGGRPRGGKADRRGGRGGKRR